MRASSRVSESHPTIARAHVHISPTTRDCISPTRDVILFTAPPCPVETKSSLFTFRRHSDVPGELLHMAPRGDARVGGIQPVDVGSQGLT